MPFRRINGRKRQKPSRRKSPKPTIKKTSSQTPKIPQKKRPNRIVKLVDQRRKGERRSSPRPAQLERRTRDDSLTRRQRQKLKEFQISRLKLGKMVAVCAHCGATKYNNVFRNTGVSATEWLRISASIKNRTGTAPNLSHGVCGTCVKELYPWFAEDYGKKGR